MKKKRIRQNLEKNDAITVDFFFFRLPKKKQLRNGTKNTALVFAVVTKSQTSLG